MKFDCGLPYGERIDNAHTAKKKWHLWFALIPRRVGPNDCRWLEWIERKGSTYLGYPPCALLSAKVEKWQYKYRSIDKEYEVE